MSRYLIIAFVILFLAGAVWEMLLNKNTIFHFARPVIADNIILIQNIRKLSDAVFLPRMLASADALPHLALKLSGRDLEKLNDALPKGDYTDIEAAGLVFNALDGGARKRVNATLVYEGREYDVRAGYRGTTYDHWYFPKKSWNIRFREESPFGFPEIDLIIPRDRHYLGEELNFFRSRKLGLFVPESEFATLSVNGRGAMVYMLVEDWNAGLPAAHGRDGCLFGANLLADAEDRQSVPFRDISAWKEYTDCGAEGEEKLAALLALLELPKKQFPAAAERLLDIEKVLRFEAATRLAGTSHAMGYNMRVFWDRGTGKFEFIPWDFGLKALEGDDIGVSPNDFIKSVLAHEPYAARLREILSAYVSAPENLREDLAYYDDLARKTEVAFYKDRLKTASILAVNEEIAKGRVALVGNVERIKAVLGISGTDDPAVAVAPAAPRIEYEEILAIPYEKREEVWAYLRDHFGEGARGFTARVDTEEFTDIYFDTRSLALLDQEVIVRYRTRSRTDKEPLVQVKTGGNAISRGEWKFKVLQDAGRVPLVGRIVNKEQKEFTDKIASLGASAGSLQPILELAQERRRIYFSEKGEDILTISLDLASTKRWWAEVVFASVDVEINEMAYTAANEARRAELRRAAAAIVADITAQLPDITPDRAPKYVKAFAALADKIPLYRFLIGIGVL